ncbi:MAG: coenzyme F420-0:L-glutamate ligase [Candidatus Kariarchaeaceae archaeon]
MTKLELFPLQTNIICSDDDLFSVFSSALASHDLSLRDNDIIVIVSKVVTVVQGGIVDLSTLTPSPEAQSLALQTGLPPEMVELALSESLDVFGVAPKSVMSLTPYGMNANGGVDRSNAPDGYALPLPADPEEFAFSFRSEIKDKMSKDVGIIIADSRVVPLRWGTSAFSLAAAGFVPVVDKRGEDDIYGHKMSVTLRSLSDNLATAANILMGETNELIPFVVIRGASITPSEERLSSTQLVNPEDCLFFGPFKRVRHQLEDLGHTPSL